MKKILYYSPYIPLLGICITILAVCLPSKPKLCNGEGKTKHWYISSAIQAISVMVILHMYFPNLMRK